MTDQIESGIGPLPQKARVRVAMATLIIVGVVSGLGAIAGAVIDIVWAGQVPSQPAWMLAGTGLGALTTYLLATDGKTAP